MTTKVLLTHHHRDAIENAADRGFWMPLPLEAEQLKDVMYLTSLSYGETTLKQLVEVASFEPWRESDGIERWLPFLGQRLELPLTWTPTTAPGRSGPARRLASPSARGGADHRA